MNELQMQSYIEDLLWSANTEELHPDGIPAAPSEIEMIRPKSELYLSEDMGLAIKFRNGERFVITIQQVD